MKNVKEFIHPKTLAEAREIVKSKPNAQFMSGGTAFRLHANDKVETIVNLKNVVSSKIDEKNGEIILGANASCEDIHTSRLFEKPELICLKNSAKTIGGPGLRNQITLGGNSVIKYPWSNLPVALLVLDAKFKIEGNSSRTLTSDEFLAQPKGKSMEDSEVLTEVNIPITSGYKTSWFRFGYNENDIPILNMAVGLKVNGNKAEKARVVVGAVTALPTRLSETEAYLNKGFNKDTIFDDLEKTLTKDVESLKLINDIRVDNNYQKNLVLTKARREILNLLGL